MSVRLLRVRHIGRPVVVVALPQWPSVWSLPPVLGRLGALWRWLNAAPPISPIPPYLREDMGLPPDPLPRDWRDRPHHPVDPTILHAWRRWW
jgi:hypothetical protein